MIKNKKLVSLICAIAMIFTMLSSFTIASADGASITLSDPVLSDDAKTATVDINYAGIEGGVAAGSIKIQMPEEVTAVSADPSATVVNLASDGMFTYNFALGTAAKTDTDGKLTTLTITLSDGLAAAKEIKIADGSYVGPSAKSKYTVGATEAAGAILPIESNTVAIPADPSAPTPKPTTDATPAPVATEKPSDGPVFDEPVSADTSGLNFGTPVTSDDGLTVTLPITYIGIEGGVAAGSVKIQMPEEVTAVSADPSATVVNLASDGMFTYNFALGTAAKTDTEGTLTTLTLTLSKALEDDVQLTFEDGSYVGPSAKKKYTVNGTATDSIITIPASNVIIEGSSEEPEPQTVVGTVGLSDAVKKTVTDTPDETTKESDYFIIPEVTVVNPETKAEEPAKYGEDGDYVAVIGDTVLSEAQYSNLINGHLGADNVKDIVEANDIKDINDVVSNLKLRVYNNTAKVAAKLVEKETGEIQNGDDKPITVDAGNPTPTPKPTPAPAMTIDVTSGGKTVTSVEVKSIVTVTVEVPEKVQVEGAKLAKDLVLDHADYLELISSTVNDTTAEYKYQAVKSGTVKITANYVKEAEDKDADDTVVATANTSLKITKASDNDSKGSSSSSSSSTGSTGIIARGNYATGVVTGGGTFTDINEAPWATEAITMLNAQNIVSGYEDNTFRPNGNITRAEYAQILINAIGHNGDSADTYFNDVPTDAWFYHNIAVASQLGIVQGYGDGNFGPYDLITREQMALMTQKAAQVMNVNLAATTSVVFDDDAAIADWSKAAVYELANAGIINGMGDGTFAPKDNATRAQASVIIYNTFVK